MTKKETTAYSILTQEFNLLVDEPLKKYTSFNIGGPADLLAQPKNRQELKQVLKKASELDIPITVIGGGTNLLITDKGIRGLTIITPQIKSEICILGTDASQTLMRADAGERLSRACQIAINHSLSGLEFAAGIPGSIGGAVKMNAGTQSGDMAGIVHAIDVLNLETFETNTIDKNNLDFSYRHLNQAGIIVSVILGLTKGNQKKIKATFKQNLTKRNATQPVSSASAGCFFKNPAQGMSAGELIEKCGLKGVKVNDAMVSEIHANYLVNVDAARCEDVLRLKQHVQETVFKKYHINLEAEVRMEGE